MQKQSDKFSFSLLTLLATLSLLVVLIVLATSLVKHFYKRVGGTPYASQELVAERLTPYGRVNTGNLVSDVVKAKSPQDVYAGLCASCHDTGLNDAPLTGDNTAWSARFAERGLDGLHDSSLHGRNLMPAKGGDPRLTDEEVMNTVDFILSKSGIEVASNEPVEEVAVEETPTEVDEAEIVEEAQVEESVAGEATDIEDTSDKAE